jgi:hypothetical protein
MASELEGNLGRQKRSNLPIVIHRDDLSKPFREQVTRQSPVEERVSSWSVAAGSTHQLIPLSVDFHPTGNEECH